MKKYLYHGIVVLGAAGIGSFWGKSDSSLLVNRKQWWWREREREREWERVEEMHGESGREREGGREEGREGEGNSSYQIIQTGQAFCGRFTNRTRLWKSRQSQPDLRATRNPPTNPPLIFFLLRDRERENNRRKETKKQQPKEKTSLSYFLTTTYHHRPHLSLHPSLSPCTFPSLPPRHFYTAVFGRIFWTIRWFFFHPGGKIREGGGKKRGCNSTIASVLCTSFDFFFPPPFSSSCLPHWRRGGDLNLLGFVLLLLAAAVVAVFPCLSQSPQSPQDFGCAETSGAAVQLYGSCGLQDRGRQLFVASRTGSHAFPRDLRGSHPRDHGGNGETVEERVAPGQGYAAQREGFGKPPGRRPVVEKITIQIKLRERQLLLVWGKVGKDWGGSIGGSYLG